MAIKVIGSAFANINGHYREAIDLIGETSLKAGRHEDVGYDEDFGIIIYYDRETGEYVGVKDNSP